MQPFLLEALRTIRKVSGNTVPVLAWNSAALNFILRLCGPVSLGGLGDVLAKAEALAKETGKSTDEFLTQVSSPFILLSFNCLLNSTSAIFTRDWKSSRTPWYARHV